MKEWSRFQGKPFNITVIQAFAPTRNAEEAKVEWFYEDLQDLLELISKKKEKKKPFHYQIKSDQLLSRVQLFVTP